MASGNPWDEDQYESGGDDSYDFFGTDGLGAAHGNEMHVQQGDQPNYDIRAQPSPSMSLAGCSEELDRRESMTGSTTSQDVSPSGHRSWSIGSFHGLNQFPMDATSYGDQLFSEYMSTQKSDKMPSSDQLPSSTIRMNASQNASGRVGESGTAISGMNLRTRAATSVATREAVSGTQRRVLRPPVDTKVSHMPNTSSIGIHGTTSKPHWNSSNVPPQMVALVQGMHPTSGMSINQMTLAMPPQPGIGINTGMSATNSQSAKGDYDSAQVTAGSDFGDLGDDSSFFCESDAIRVNQLSVKDSTGGLHTDTILSRSDSNGGSPKAVSKKARKGLASDARIVPRGAGMTNSDTTSTEKVASTVAMKTNSGSKGMHDAVSNEVKAKEKNREHAKNTRMRKKTYIESLKDEVRILSEERDMMESAQRFQLTRKAEEFNAHKIALSTYLAYSANGEQEYNQWSQILDENFVMSLPITPYRFFPPWEVRDGARVVRGIDGVIRDTASLSVMIRSIGFPLNDGSSTSAQLYALSDEMFNSSTRLMCPFYMCTENAVERGSRSEITMYGMLTASFLQDNPNKLQALDMTFDVMAFMQQVRRCSGAAEFKVVPNTHGVASDYTSKDIRFLINLKEPNDITYVSFPFSEIFHYTAEEIIGQDLSKLCGPETDKELLMHMLEQARATRPSCGFVTLYGNKTQKCCVWLQAYPICSDGQLSHILFQMELAIKSAPAPLPLDRPRTVVIDGVSGPVRLPESSSTPYSFDPPGGNVGKVTLPQGWPIASTEIGPFKHPVMSNPAPVLGADTEADKDNQRVEMSGSQTSSVHPIATSTSNNSLDQQSSSSGGSAYKDASNDGPSSTNGSAATDMEGMDSRSGANSASSLSECLEGVFPTSSMDICSKLVGKKSSGDSPSGSL